MDGGYNFLILNDIHFNPNYTTAAQVPKSSFGWNTDMGVFGLYSGSPKTLVELILDSAQDELQGKSVDAVIITGDFVYHGFEPHTKRAPN